MESGIKSIKSTQKQYNLTEINNIICNTELAQFAMYLLTGGKNGNFYPVTWKENFEEVSKMTYEERLVKAGALIASEIDRIRMIQHLDEKYNYEPEAELYEDSPEATPDPKAFRER